LQTALVISPGCASLNLNYPACATNKLGRSGDILLMFILLHYLQPFYFI